MSGLARVKVNGFNFDSDSPVQGNVLDEAKEKTKVALVHGVLHNLLAINVSLFGFYVINWWSHGGYHWMVRAFHIWAGEIMLMTEHGLF